MSRQKLIDDTLKVLAINKDGKNFERGMSIFNYYLSFFLYKFPEFLVKQKF